MSLTDKVIKNTFYYFISQIVSLLIPMILTPYIISKIGLPAFGIYTIILGFISSFGLFDLSISTSFIKFLSEYYNKNDNENLNRVLNTGFFFYLVFSSVVAAAGFLLSETLLSLINIPQDIMDISLTAFRISLLTFFISNAGMIFSSLLISIQKMYLISLLNLVLGVLNLALTIFFLSSGYGLVGLLICQLIITSITALFAFAASFRSVKSLRLSLNSVNRSTFKKLGVFGAQMQVSKLATVLSEKYDELLLGAFSVLSNVGYFNIGNKIVRFGKVFPSQFIVQVAPTAAELHAKGENEKLQRLFGDVTRYLTVLTAPLFAFIFAFAGLIIETWMGKGYEMSAVVIRVLIIGQFVNLAFSAPGNSIIPNIGIPKYQMYEGLIHLSFNIVLTFILVKLFDIYGAAFGNTTATVIGSIFVFIISANFFGFRKTGFALKNIGIPFIASAVSVAAVYTGYYYFTVYFKTEVNRLNGIIILAVTAGIMITLFVLLIFRLNYLNDNDKVVLKKFINRFVMFRNKDE